jgi:hypothetical protein
VAYVVSARPPGGGRTWTVVDGSYRTVAPVEEWLEAHRQVWSPNTVRGYATGLAQWWTFLEQRDETTGWAELGVPAVSGFLSWLRNGRTVEHSIAREVETSPSPETLEARLAALVSFYRWQGSVNDVPVAGKLLRGRPRRAPARGLLSHLDARSEAQPSSLVRVRTVNAATGHRCCCRSRCRRSSTAAQSTTRRTANGRGICVTASCLLCLLKPA